MEEIFYAIELENGKLEDADCFDAVVLYRHREIPNALPKESGSNVVKVKVEKI